MPLLRLVALSGLRVRDGELASLGVRLPGLATRADAIARLPPLGALTLAGATPAPWEIRLHEAERVDDALVEAVAEGGPLLVGISALTASIEEAYRLSDRLRARDVPTVLGGLHATALPDEAAEHATAVVAGEAEAVWPRVLADALAGAVKSRYRAARPFDLARAPLPRLDLLGRARRPRFTLQATRGCPLACEFCGASRLLGPFRAKPVECVRAELRAIRALDPRPQVELADDNTFAGGGPHDALLEALAESGARWFTEADWRIGEDPALLARLAAAGCVQVLIGMESRVFPHPGMGRKRAPRERVLDAVRAIQAAGIAVVGCHVLGSDGEDEASLDRLGEELEDDPCADVQLTLETPFPGTALHRRRRAEGRLLREADWSRYTLFDVTFRPTHLAPETLEERFRELQRHAHRAEAAARRARIRRALRRGPEAADPAAVPGGEGLLA